MRRPDRKLFDRRNVGRAAAIALLPLVAACTDFSMNQVNPLPRVSSFVSNSTLAFSNYSGNDMFKTQPLTEADFINPDGSCASAPLNPAAPPSPDPADQGLIQGGIALQMSECDVVRRAGRPDNIEMGAGERGARSLVLTYNSGPRPGIYRFASGRLYTVERGAELTPPPAKPKAKPAKKKTAAPT
jgi:hypothetical protein